MSTVNLDARNDQEASDTFGFFELEEACGGETALEKEDDEDDVLWSLWSNCFFVSGGLFYVVASSWDVYRPPTQQSSFPFTWFVYNALWTLGPTVYLLNSIIDVCWAWRARTREKQRRLRRQYLRSLEAQSSNNADADNGTSDKRKQKKKLFSHLKSKHKKLFKRIRKHVGHRRDLSAAIAFGIAAFFGLLSMLVSFMPSLSSSEMTSFRLEFLSIHCYLVSAVFALCGRRAKPVAGGVKWCKFWSNADRLEDLGDTFFGIGSIVDVILCDLHFDDDVLYWPVISAVLWLLDALFYLRSDFVNIYSHTATYKELDTGEDSETSISDSITMTSTDIYFPSPS